MTTATIRILSGLVLLSVVSAVPALAVTVDGQLDADYGAPAATQAVQTQFGDNGDPDIGASNGSELDVAYGVIQGGSLYLFFAGNLENNFNKLDVFIDVDGCPNGQNTLRNDNPDVDFNGLNRMGEGVEGPGLTFEAECCPDYYLTVGGNGTDLFANYAELLTGGGGLGDYIGQGGYGTDGTLVGGNINPGVKVTINNSNVGGVVSGCDADDGSGVTTGIEWEIPLTALGGGGGGGCVNVVAFVNGGGHDFLSNQVMGPLVPSQCNLGEPRLVDFSQLPGLQKFEACEGSVQTESTTWGQMKSTYR
jgi:hypothetical protein